MQSQAPRGFVPRLRTETSSSGTGPPRRPAAHAVRAAQPGRPARLQQPGSGAAAQGQRRRDGLHGPARGREGLEPEPGADADEARAHASLPDARPLGSLDPVREHAGAARHRQRAGAGFTVQRGDADQPALPRPFAVLPGRLARREAGRERGRRGGRADPPLVGRLLRTESKAYLSGLAATRADPARQTIPSAGRAADTSTGTRSRPARPRAPSAGRWRRGSSRSNPTDTRIAACPAFGSRPWSSSWPACWPRWLSPSSS